MKIGEVINTENTYVFKGDGEKDGEKNKWYFSSTASGMRFEDGGFDSMEDADKAAREHIARFKK